MLRLDVAICTYKPEGIARVEKMLRPIGELPWVRYVVSWQEHLNSPLPDYLLGRKDVSVYRFEEKGLSRNRNNSISKTTGDIVYISDDDLVLTEEGFRNIVKRFEEYPDTEVATFMMKEKGIKVYPAKITELKFYLPKGYNVGSCQIAFKREVFYKIKFNTSYGIGSGKFEVGEDELFHLEARKNGLKCRFFPDIVASHPHEASGRRKISDKRILHAFGALMIKSYPRSFFLRLPLKAYRLQKNRKYNFFGAVFHLAKGCYLGIK